MADLRLVPGGSAVLRIQVRKYDGSLAVLDGGSVSTNISAVGVADEPASQVVEPDDHTRLIVISGAQTAARAGKQITVRSFIVPNGSYETVASETRINVGL